MPSCCHAKMLSTTYMVPSIQMTTAASNASSIFSILLGIKGLIFRPPRAMLFNILLVLVSLSKDIYIVVWVSLPDAVTILFIVQVSALVREL